MNLALRQIPFVAMKDLATITPTSPCRISPRNYTHSTHTTTSTATSCLASTWIMDRCKDKDKSQSFYYALFLPYASISSRLDYILLDTL